MTFVTYEMSRQDGQPASLFYIEWGSGPTSFYAYTDSDVEITFDGVTYVPTVIGRADIESSGTLDRKALEIDITPNAEVVRMYATNPPSTKVGLTIRQGHVNDPDNDWPVVWTGIVKNVNWEPPLAKVIGEPLDTVMARPGLRRHYMFGCPHVLYDDRTCKADKEILKRTLTPASIGTNFVNFAAGWSGNIDRDKYIGGYLQWTDENGNLQIRTAIDFGANQNQIIIGSTAGLTTTTTVFFFAGCNRQQSDCRNLHDNIVNYGGQPYIPLKNPVGFINRFY